jgi:RNA polymerase sigma-70 factor (ECF subfamily)
MANYRELTENYIETKSDKAFTALYNRIKPGLTSYVYKIVKDSEIAEDIAVNTLTKMWTKIDQYDPKYQITTWLYRIAFNESLGYISKRNKKTSLDQLGEFGVEVNNTGMTTVTLDDALNHFEEMTEQDYLDEQDSLMETYGLALEAMNGLKGMYKEIVVDRLINNMKYDEIAEKHNVSLQTVKNRIRRGKALIAEQIGAA